MEEIEGSDAEVPENMLNGVPVIYTLDSEGNSSHESFITGT
jgi:hypothetical protein